MKEDLVFDRYLDGLCPICLKELPGKYDSTKGIAKWVPYKDKRIRICIHHVTPFDKVTMKEGKIINRETGEVIDSSKEPCLKAE